MMYYINKIVWWLANPTNLFILLCAVSALMIRMRRERIARIGVIGLCVGTVLSWLWMTTLPTRMLALPLEREWLVGGRVPSVESYPTADAIVLLGGSMHLATNLSDYAEMWSSADRVWHAARLYKAGKSQKIFVTGEENAKATQGLLADFGIPKEALIFAEQARNTEEEAKEIAKHGVKSILLVTSAGHMRRAKLMFEKYAKGIEVVPAPADFEATVFLSDGFRVEDFVPNAAAMSMNGFYLHEWIGYIGYKYFR